MFVRLLLAFLFLFSVAELSFSAVKKLASIKPIVELDSVFMTNFHDSGQNEIIFSLREVIFGVEVTIKDNILMHIDFELSGDTGNLGSIDGLDDYVSAGGGLEIEPHDIFAEVTFSNVYPFYMKIGKFKLGNTIIHKESPFIRENNFVSAASLVNTFAMEFGYSYGNMIRIGAGAYYVDNVTVDNAGNKDNPSGWYTNIDNYYVYLNFHHISGDLDFILNAGFTSNVSDSDILGYAEENLSEIPNGVIETILRYKEGYFLFAASFPALITARFEGAYDSDTMTVGIYTNVRINTGGEPLVISYEGDSVELPNFRPPLRLGGMFAYKMFEGFSLGIEGYYDLYIQANKGYDANITLRLTYELPDYTFYF